MEKRASVTVGDRGLCSDKENIKIQTGYNMELQPAKPTFETIMLFKKIPYWLYWPAIGFLFFVFGELLIWAFA
ncbi:MAG: hypothetical protein E4G94_10970 [ANME-2 cluster archaeon]|nr:MAG: hypothetical protein E4G94_10970 [ANME-2 cluster archaeon]